MKNLITIGLPSKGRLKEESIRFFEKNNLKPTFNGGERNYFAQIENFPNAKIFLGDSGSYLFGALIAMNTIVTNNLNPQISSFFFCILLFYLFFEVFFSFLRKLYQKKSPVHPDRDHLHMLCFKKMSSTFDAIKSNYLTSITINFIFLCLVLPSLYFANNSFVCKYWFFSLILVYCLFYIGLYRLTKN